MPRRFISPRKRSKNTPAVRVSRSRMTVERASLPRSEATPAKLQATTCPAALSPPRKRSQNNPAVRAPRLPIPSRAQRVYRGAQRPQRSGKHSLALAAIFALRKFPKNARRSRLAIGRFAHLISGRTTNTALASRGQNDGSTPSRLAVEKSGGAPPFLHPLTSALAARVKHCPVPPCPDVLQPHRTA